jgi:AcrR family transcriptional regulator
MAERRKTGSYAVGRARKDAILGAATSHFTRSGYAQTPMAQIAADVGISERGLLHHFPSKKHLLLAVAARRFAFAVQWVADVPDDGGIRALRALRELTAHFLEQPGLIELFVLVTAEAADRSSPAFALYSEQYERAVRDLEADFRRGVESGLLRGEVDYLVLARRCIAICDGLQLQWVLSGGSMDLMGQLDAYLDEVATAITASPGSIDRSWD